MNQRPQARKEKDIIKSEEKEEKKRCYHVLLLSWSAVALVSVENHFKRIRECELRE